MTAEMIERADGNKQKLGIAHVEFRHGEIENLPVEDNTVDVVLSNCVLNLVPDKDRAFREIWRVLTPGGHFTVSDIVLEGDLSPALRMIAELYVGCVAGAMQRSEYLACIRRAGFSDVEVLKEKEIRLPEGLQQRILKGIPEEERTLAESRVLSVTVKGSKTK
jgi:ubiquinone/menaquinone biosynthesis C-methylase UbiE